MHGNYIQYDSFDNFNKSVNSGISSALRSSELSKDEKSSYKIISSQPKPQHKKYRLAQSLRNSKMSYYFSRESHRQRYQRRNFTELRFTFLSQSKMNPSYKNSQIAHPSQPSYPRINHRKTEERRSPLINRRRSIEKITYNNPSARTYRAAKSLGRNTDLLLWNMIPESFKGMDFDTYVPMRKLGAGAHGSAFEVLHKSGQTIVTKFFGKEQRRSFRHEAAVLAQLKKISELLTNNTFEFDIEPYFEVEYCYCLNLVAGMGTLGDFINFLSQKDFPLEKNFLLDQQELLFIFEKLFESYLNLAKLNYAHRDIKPGNIILDPKDLTPKFIDYSLAACYGGTKQITGIVGTRGYISPFLEESPFTKWELISADLYSLGVTILEVALPKIDIVNCPNKAKLVENEFKKTMPILEKVLKTLLSDSKKKLSILRRIYNQKDLFKNEDFKKMLKEGGSDNEEAIDNFKPPKNENFPLAEKYLQDFIKFLKPQNSFNEEEKDSNKTANNEFPDEEESDHPLSLARKAVKLFQSDPQPNNEIDANQLSEKIKACLLGLDKEKTENKEHQLILLNNLRFLSEKYGIRDNNDKVFQKEDLRYPEVIENLLFRRNRSDNLPNTASEFLYKDELITKHPQKLTTDNLNLIILKNYCLNEFEKMLKTLHNQQPFISKLKNFVSSNYEFSELLLSTMVNLQGHLHLLIVLLDFVEIFLNISFPEIQIYIGEANIIKKDSQSLYDKFIKSDFHIGMQEIKNYQLFYLIIGAVLYYHDQIPKTEKSLYDIEQKIQSLSKGLNKEIFLFFQSSFEHDKFPKIQNLVDLCWKDEETKELIYRYVYKYSPGSSKPDLIGLHLYKRANYRLKDLSAWINKEFEKLRGIPDIYLEIEAYIEKDKQTIEDLKNSLSLLTNLKKVKLHLVQPFKAKDKAQNKIEKDKYDEFLFQTLEIISSLKYSPQLEIVFDFIYISPIGLQSLGEKICELRQLKMIEMEFSYCPHITDESVKKVIANICFSLELELLVFKLFACQRVIYMDSIESVLRISGMETISRTKKIDFVCQPYSEHHSRAEVAGVVSQGFPLFL